MNEWLTIEERMMAFKDGKTLILHKSNSTQWKYRLNLDNDYDLELYSDFENKWVDGMNISFYYLLEGKWTIED